MRLVVTSAQRVGSRWLRDMLSNYFSLKIQDEISIHSYNQELENIKTSLLNRTIVKIHDVLPSEMEQTIPLDNLYFVGLVRDPRDTAVSYAFHHRYHEWEDSIYKHLPDDESAVKYAVIEDPIFNMECEFQIQLLTDRCENSRYAWTVYKNLQANTTMDLVQLLSRLDIVADVHKLNRIANLNSFSRQTKRNPGLEKRNDMWRRKGIVGDWGNWFDDEMLEELNPLVNKFYSLIGERG